MFQKLIRTWPVWFTLPVRLGLGVVFIAHGTQKVFGAWGGRGLSAFMENPAPLGLKPAWLWMAAAALSELIGGLLVLFGLVTRLGAVLIFIVMLVAILGVHWAGGFFLKGGDARDGIEYAFTLALMCVALLISGGGRYSLDYSLMDPRNRRR
jgi:putative oxidoreductase